MGDFQRATGWRGHVFLSAPHRAFFAGGVVMLLASLLWWGIELAGRAGILPMWSGWQVPATWWHAGCMLYGVFSWFIFGFLLTAMPRWQAVAAPSQGDWLPAFLMFSAGWGCYLLAPWLPLLFVPALVLVAIGWLRVLWALVRMTRGSEVSRMHAWVVVAALAAGAAGVPALLAALVGPSLAAYRLAVAIGFWGFLLPLFFTVLHRMLPFFTQMAIPVIHTQQPDSFLWLAIGGWYGHLLLVVLGFEPLAGLADLAALLGVGMFCWCGQLRASLRIPMLAILQLALLWLLFGLVLDFLQGVLVLIGSERSLGLMPLHAVSLGFFTSVLFGMATRVTFGHSGRQLADDRWAWPLFLAFQGVVVLRLLSELVADGSLLLVGAAIGWLLIWGLWARVHLPMWLRPRPDGQPG